MANTYVLLSYPISCSSAPPEPRSDSQLSEMLLSDPAIATEALQLIARSNLVLGMALNIITYYTRHHTKARGLLFLAKTFAVLDAAALDEATQDLRRLLEDIRLRPRLAIEPRVITHADGSKHDPYDEAYVLRSLESAPIVVPPAHISSDYEDLAAMFSFLKSELSLFAAAQKDHKCVVHLTYNELSEYLQAAQVPSGSPLH